MEGSRTCQRGRGGKPYSNITAAGAVDREFVYIGAGGDDDDDDDGDADGADDDDDDGVT